MSSIWGDKQHEQRARIILPLLVRQAQAQQPITYDALSHETGIHRRAFRHPLGTVAEALHELGVSWGEAVPALTSMVIYKDTGRPGPGFGWAVTGMDDYARLPAWQQKAEADRIRRECFHYHKWPAVLAELGLPPVEPAVSPALVNAARGGVGEGEAHRRLKEYVAANPGRIGLARSAAPGKMEYLLPSADAIDVLFEHKSKHERVAVEVKAANAGTADILRGLFQCVKYEALLAAEQAVTGEPAGSRAVLVLEGKLPDELVAARNTLGITVFERVSPVS